MGCVGTSDYVSEPLSFEAFATIAILPIDPDGDKAKRISPRRRKRLIIDFAEFCSRECGGYPDGCTCAEQLLNSTGWLSWPQEKLEIALNKYFKILRRQQHQNA